jgi:hypothetical protein
MTTTSPIAYEAMQARMDDMRRAGERSRVAAAAQAKREPTREVAEDRIRRRAITRWLRLA